MATNSKRKMITVEPISKVAKIRFDELMSNLHSCYVDNEDDDNYFLTSVNGVYKFILMKKNDSHWRMIK